MPLEPYYRRDLAFVHDRGFGFHAEACAPGILKILEDVRERNGLVLELGCGSGLLTKELIAAGHRVIATDASLAMLEIARGQAAGTEEIRQLVLPDDPLPEADAIVSIGHVISYLDDADAIDRALVAIARAVAPGGVFAIDICDFSWGEARSEPNSVGWVGDDWAIIQRTTLPSPDKYVREMTTFVRNDDGSWRRDDERHDNVLIDTSRILGLLAEHGVETKVSASFGSESLPHGLHVVVGHRPA